jgi:hypothetical protein
MTIHASFQRNGPAGTRAEGSVVIDGELPINPQTAKRTLRSALACLFMECDYRRKPVPAEAPGRATSNSEYNLSLR